MLIYRTNQSTNMEYISVICLITLILFGIVCNTFAIWYLYSKNKKQSIKDKITTSLCIINLVQVVGYVVELYSTVRGNISDSLCEFGATLICICTYTSIGCFVALLFVRYMFILYPYKYSWFASKMSATIGFVLPLAYGLFFGTAPLLGWGRYGRSRVNATYCGFDFTDKSEKNVSFFFTTLIFTFFLPIMMTIACFAHILIELRRTATLFSTRFGRRSQIARESNKRVHEQYIYSLLNFLIYIISWAPYAVVCSYFYSDRDVSLTLEYFAIYLSKSCTISSPIIFCLIEKRVCKSFAFTSFITKFLKT